MKAQLHNCEISEARAAAIKFLRSTREKKAAGPAGTYTLTNFATSGPSTTPLRDSQAALSRLEHVLRPLFGKRLA